jgi:hypothetical protein
MKIPFSRFILAGALFVTLLGPSSARAAYVNRPFNAGDNLFVNPLHAGDNTLSNLFVTAAVPNGTTVSLWNPATSAYDTTSTFNALNGSWSVNLLLAPGTGARLTTSSSFGHTFVGSALNHDGSLLNFNDPFVNPPPYAGPNALLLLGDKTPIVNTGNDIFLHILGRNPNIGEQVITLTTTSTYLGGGAWDNMPFLGVSDAAFLNVGPVPEPATTALTLMGLALIRAFRRKA